MVGVHANTRMMHLPWHAPSPKCRHVAKISNHTLQQVCLASCYWQHATKLDYHIFKWQTSRCKPSNCRYLVETTTLSSFSHLFTIQMYSNGFFPVIGTHLHLQQLSTLAFRQDHGAGKVIGLHCIAEHHLPQRGGWHQRLVQQSQTQSSFVAKIFGPIFSDQLMSWNEKKLKSKLVQINRVKT